MNNIKTTILCALFGILSFGALVGTPLHNVSAEYECTVVSASFEPGLKTIEGTMDTANSETKKFFHDSNPPIVTIVIKTKDCTNQTVYVNIGSTDSKKTPLTGFDLALVSEFNSKAFVVPDTNSFEIVAKTGDSKCSASNTGPDCQYYIYATPEKNNLNSPRSVLSRNLLGVNSITGRLAYDCDGTCDLEGNNWEIISDTSANKKEENSVAGETKPSPLDKTSNCYDAATDSMIPDCYSLYGGLSDFLGAAGNNLKRIDTSAGLGTFINTLIAVALGIAGVATVLLIMWDGFTYWTAGKEGNESKMGDVKGRVWKRVLGLLLLFSIYTLLRTINPDLLNLTPRIDVAALITGSQSSLPEAEYTAITGEPLKSPSEYDALAKQVATKFSSDYCALRVIMQNESRGNPNVVGQDENVRDPGIPSRVAFINSGKKYSGATFSPATKLITEKGFCNDAAGCAGGVPSPKSPTLGLDWRFTKGIGLTQITFFPNDYDSFKQSGYVPNYANKNNPPSRTFNFSTGTMKVTPAEMFNPEKNLEVSAKLWNEGIKKCNNSPTGAFYTYACGQCNCAKNSFAKTEVSERVSQYNQCKQENP